MFFFLQPDIVKLEDDKFNKHKQDKVKVRVYYEALCPDSKHFFMKHLAPVAQKLSDFVDVTLVPYGKASVSICLAWLHHFYHYQFCQDISSK